MKRLILFMLFVISLCTACQATPKEPPVAAKDNTLSDAIQKSNDNTNLNNQLNIPNKYEDNYSIGPNNLKVTISANIKTPEKEVFPVIEVVPDKIDKEKMDSIVNNLFGDVQIYESSMIKQTLTKTEIEEEIFKLKNQLNNPNSDFNKIENYKDMEEYELYHQRVKDRILELEILYNKAPESIEETPLAITEDSLKEGAEAFVYDDNNKKIYFYVSANEYEKGRANSFTCFYPRNNIEGLFTTNDDSIPEINEITAINLANNLVEKLSIDNMIFNRLIVVDGFQDSSYKQYDVIFTKSYNGIMETYTVQEQGEIEFDTNIYTFPWFYEKIIIRVDNYGINFIQWFSPSKENSVLTENVEILGFDKVMELFKQYIEFKAAWADNDENIISRQLYIDEITLGTMRISIKDSTDKYMVIPVWDFFGYTVDKYNEQQPGGWELDENNEFINKVEAHSFLTINAIDGSIIDRALGY